MARYYCIPSNGWELAIKRYKPRKYRAGVILCHGLAANKNSIDFGNEGTKKWEKYSLASFLYKQNKIKFDVWVVELRGRNTWKKCEGQGKYNWCIDDYIHQDMPSIINFIRSIYKGEETKLYWIGKSMGGMIAYGYGEFYDGLDGVITIASPVSFEHSQLWKELLARIAPRRIAGPINLGKVLRELKLTKLLEKNIANPDNIDKKILQEYVEKGLDNRISWRVLEQFGIFYRHNDFCAYPKYPWLYDTLGRLPFFSRYFAPYSYKKNLHKFRLPLLALAGGGDKTATPEEVRYAVGHVGSTDARYHEFSESNGYSADYGHLDLNLGIKAREEVYPVIYEWLVEKSDKT